MAESEILLQPFVCIFNDASGSSTCMTQFSTRNEFKEHVRTTHSYFLCTRQGCPVANIYFTHSKELITAHHGRMRHPNQPRICEISRCPQFTSRFGTKGAFIGHEMSVHKLDPRIMEMVNNSNVCRDPDCESYSIPFNSIEGLQYHVGKRHTLLRVYSCDSPECAKWNLNTYYRWNNHRMDCSFLESSGDQQGHLPRLQASQHATDQIPENTMDNSDLEAILDGGLLPSSGEDLDGADFDVDGLERFGL